MFMNSHNEIGFETIPPILHTGVVKSFDGQLARVQIYHGGNCGACPAKGGCASASLGEDGQVVEVHYSGELVIGQKVNVALRSRTDFLAIILAFGVPIILLVATILGLARMGFNQITTALIAIGTVVAYLCVLVLVRARLQHKFELMIVV